MRAINILLSVIVSLVIAGLLLEAGLRVIGFAPTETINQFDPDLGWSKRPDATVRRKTSEFDITIATNDEGLRDDQGPAKPANTFRVVMLGDSFTLGFTVAREDTFADLCERWWRSQDRRVEVINAGTEGWSTDQEVLWFLEHGVDYAPDLVLLFPYDNDIYWCGEERYQRFPKPRFLADGTLEQRPLTDPGPRSWYQGFALGRFLAGPPKPDPKDYFQPDGATRRIYKEFAPVLVDAPAFLADAEARTKGALRALKAKTDELGARLVVAPIPSEMVVSAGERERFEPNVGGLAWNPERPVDLFLAMARELAITTLDARQALKLAGQDERLYFQKEWHFTPAGNRHFAEFLVSQLDELGAFPGEHSAIAAGDFTAPDDDSGGGVPTWLWVYGGLLVVLGTTYTRTYRDEAAPVAFAKVAGLLALVFTIVIGGTRLVGLLPPSMGPNVLVLFLVVVLGFVAYKLGRKIATIAELLKAFTLRGHWYLMPLVVVLLTIGSLLVVAASSPLIAPFIYTLF